ncbi:hypothetical protein Pla123a_07590 [Posidoniimonas polymericola]|uniref:Uncharacterized protein n=1 Tax=Posidoniimonas polymericola TaxID=2528002 RepID=A0A5C5ZF47_9BACT|nr:hypothetical protein [Posidoniimonas polymericola]TWT85952.1 hypothetical protein Pla123a_07590 [Posidoniimonas polymericola]
MDDTKQNLVILLALAAVATFSQANAALFAYDVFRYAACPLAGDSAADPDFEIVDRNEAGLEYGFTDLDTGSDHVESGAAVPTNVPEPAGS